uniref:Uncharacterized protein n=1 Tax=Panagrolaimus sp. JU765 TaxID=591449 RepID=A0AC34QB09_9BILA
MNKGANYFFIGYDRSFYRLCIGMSSNKILGFCSNYYLNLKRVYCFWGYIKVFLCFTFPFTLIYFGYCTKLQSYFVMGIMIRFLFILFIDLKILIIYYSELFFLFFVYFILLF